MKKIIITALCALFIFNLSSCKAKTTSTVTSSEPKIITLAEVKGYMEKGELLGADLKLGTAPDAVKKFYHYGEDLTTQTDANGAAVTTTAKEELDNDFAKYLIITDGDTVKMDVQVTQYYYKKADAGKGISAIVQFGKAYNFDTGNVDRDTIVNSIGAPEKEDVPSSSDLFFIPDSPTNVKRLTYVDGKYKLDFIVQEDSSGDYMLMATVLADTSVWSK